MIRKIKLVPKQNQRIQIKKGEVKITEQDGFTFVEFPFASNFPVERFFGKEVLSMAPGAMITARFEQYMPLLFNHDLNLQIGVIDSAWLGDDGRWWCKAKLSRTEFGKEKEQDIRDEILMNVSFWYDIKDLRLMSEVDGVPTYEITSYESLEISMVTVAADPTVGMGRSAQSIDKTTEVELEVEVADPAPPPETVTEPAAVVDDPPPAETVVTEKEKISEDVDDDVQRNLNLKTNQEGVRNMSDKSKEQQEQERIMSILKLAAMHGENELAQRFITENKRAADFGLELATKLGGTVRKINDKPLDLTDKEANKYSLARAMAAHMNNDWTKAGFERECSVALATQMGRDTKGFYVPNNMKSQIRSPYLAGTANVGGNLVATQLLSAEFIDIQRARTKVIQAGARVLTGLKGLIAIPRKSGGSAYYWIAENGAITQTNATFDQVIMSPKKIGALSYFTRDLLVQADPSIDALIVDDLTKSIALGQDAGAITGTGSSGQPLGILNQSGIGSVAIGTNGGALSFDHLIDLETKVADNNFDEDTMCYMTNSKQIGNLKKLKDSNNNYLWQKADSRLVGAKGEINSYHVYRTNQVPRTLTKGSSSGVCSAVLFGDFSQVLIAQWMPGTEILMNPYGSGFANDAMEVRAVSLIDVALRQPGAFAAITDAT